MNADSLDALKGFYLVTIGGAKAQKLDDRVGNFENDKEADFIVVDTNWPSILRKRLDNSDDLHDQLFALVMLGDNRNIIQTYVMGVPQL